MSFEDYEDVNSTIMDMDSDGSVARSKSKFGLGSRLHLYYTSFIDQGQQIPVSQMGQVSMLYMIARIKYRKSSTPPRTTSIIRILAPAKTIPITVMARLISPTIISNIPWIKLLMIFLHSNCSG